MEHTSPTPDTPLPKDTHQVLLQSTPALPPLCVQSGVAISAKAPSPHSPASQAAPPTHATSPEHLVHPGPFARDAQIQQHSAHFLAKGISSVPLPSALCPPQVWFLPLVYFLQTLHYVNSTQCSHCITSYLIFISWYSMTQPDFHEDWTSEPCTSGFAPGPTYHHSRQPRNHYFSH